MTIEIKGRQLPVGVSNEMMQNLGLWIPMGRGGTPEEAAGAVFLMCLPEANYITGHVLAASGGY
jgi:3-oxoacyl-[acyl-carrier protein] reductase